MQTTMKTCAVIGAGPSGLPSAKWALEYGYKTTVFEATDDIGGLWNYKPGETEFATVMKSTVINTSKDMTAYSDYPPPDNTANYMHHSQLKKYFKAYSDHYGVTENIRFNCRVLNVQRTDDYSQTGRWRIKFRDENNDENEEIFDCVLVCTGHHATPQMAHFEGQEQFRGRIIHSHSYKTHAGYEDKRALVVGVGNSALDCAAELSRVCKIVYLSTRRGTWILQKTSENGYPSDCMQTRYRQWMAALFPGHTEKLVTQWLDSRMNHEHAGLRPNHTFFQQHPSLSDEIQGRIMTGTVVVKGNVKKFRSNSVVFEDGVEVEIDEVVMGTGYAFDFPYLEGGKLVPVKNNHVKLYKKMYPPATSDHNTLAVIGLHQPRGSIMPISEMQARVFFAAHTGQIQLPNRKLMEAECDRVEEELWKRYIYSPRHTIQVDYAAFMDELAAMIGAKPQFLRYLADPPLLKQLIFGPVVPYQFRLNGLSARRAESRQLILTVEERRIRGIHNRDTGAKPQPKSRVGWLKLVALMGMVGCAVWALSGGRMPERLAQLLPHLPQQLLPNAAN